LTIEAHSKLADFYDGRPPYVDDFFRQAGEQLGITPQSTLLDLCCGRGELASGFAAACRSIDAVDGSPQMLARRIERPNVTFRLHDVNREDLALAQAVDHIVVGSAIHWVDPSSLGRLIERNLKPGGKVLVTHTLMKFRNQPWSAPLARFNARFGRSGQGRSYQELAGVDRLGACGFGKVDGLRIVRHMRFGPEYLLRSQLSYLYAEFYGKVSQDIDAYRRGLAETIAPFLDSERKLSATLVNWGVIYARRPSD
jgi:ubiquinone/menaquinone biosynthesis C-methylase UbiE